MTGEDGRGRRAKRRRKGMGIGREKENNSMMGVVGKNNVDVQFKAMAMFAEICRCSFSKLTSFNRGDNQQKSFQVN